MTMNQKQKIKITKIRMKISSVRAIAKKNQKILKIQKSELTRLTCRKKKRKIHLLFLQITKLTLFFKKTKKS